MAITDRPSGHFSDRQGQKVRYIIVHSTAAPVGATAKNALDYLVGPNDRGVSSHEVTSPGDEAYILVPDDLAAHHCEGEKVVFPDGTPWYLANEITWGVEAFQVVGKPVGEEVHMTTLKRVVAACQRFGLDASSVLGHREIDPANRSDPVGIDMDEFRAAVAELLLAEQLLAEGEKHQAIQFNPQAALQRRIFADGFVPNSPEFDLEHGGVKYRAQRAEDLKEGKVRVYYAQIDDWEHVRFAERAPTK